MGRFKEMLLGRGYNLKERAYIYTGLAAGVAAPIVAGRYFIAPAKFEGENAILMEGLAWTTSLIANVGGSILLRGVPLLYTTAFGILSGTLAAEASRIKRQENKQIQRRIEIKGIETRVENDEIPHN